MTAAQAEKVIDMLRRQDPIFIDANYLHRSMADLVHGHTIDIPCIVVEDQPLPPHEQQTVAKDQ